MFLTNQVPVVYLQLLIAQFTKMKSVPFALKDTSSTTINASDCLQNAQKQTQMDFVLNVKKDSQLLMVFA